MHDVIVEDNLPASRIRSIKIPKSFAINSEDTQVWEVRKNLFAIVKAW